MSSLGWVIVIAITTVVCLCGSFFWQKWYVKKSYGNSRGGRY